MQKLNKFSPFVMNRLRAFLGLLLFLFFIAVILVGNTAMAETPLADQQLTGNEARGFLAREGILNEIANDLTNTSSEGKNFEEPSPLLASDSSSWDWFGYSVAVDGSTLLVGTKMNWTHGAAYVYRYDGFQWNQEQKITVFDGYFFGYSVALSGSVAVIGAPTSPGEDGTIQGAVYIFHYDGTQWNQAHKLLADDGAVGDFFGNSIDIAEDTIIVGASNANIDGANDQGAAYIFRHDGLQWMQEQKLIADGGSEDDHFGTSVALSGNKAIVGTFEDLDGEQQGAAYIFKRVGGTWLKEQKLVDSGGQAYDHFGTSVDLEGNTAVVGATDKNIVSATGAGAVNIYKYNGTTWQQEQMLHAGDATVGASFGFSVAVEEDTLIIGATLARGNGNANTGAAYIFSYNGSSWEERQKLIAAEGALGDHFGFSVALNGDIAVIGAPLSEVNSLTSAGMVYISRRGPVPWPLTGNNTANDGDSWDHLGVSVALDGETAVAGATGADIGGNNNQGAAYVFIRNGPIWVQQQKLVAVDGAAGDSFGASVAIDGDTILIGASLANVNGNGEQGAAYLFQRNGNTWTQLQKLVASDGDSDHGFGHTVALSGDTAVVGALWAEVDGQEKQGAVYIFKHNGTIWNQTQKLVATDGAEGDYFGSALALDANRLLIGAERAVVDGTDAQGAAYVFQYDGANWTQTQKLIADDGLSGDLFGQAVGLHDSNILIGAAGAAVNGLTDQGAVYAFRNNGTTWQQEQKLVASDGRAGDSFGSSLAVWGKTAVIGAPLAQIGINVEQGAAYSFRQYGVTWQQEQKLLTFYGYGEANDAFGQAVALYDNTALISAPLAAGWFSDQGQIFFYERHGFENYLPLIQRK